MELEPNARFLTFEWLQFEAKTWIESKTFETLVNDQMTLNGESLSYRKHRIEHPHSIKMKKKSFKKFTQLTVLTTNKISSCLLYVVAPLSIVHFI